MPNYFQCADKNDEYIFLDMNNISNGELFWSRFYIIPFIENESFSSKFHPKPIAGGISSL